MYMYMYIFTHIRINVHIHMHRQQEYQCCNTFRTVAFLRTVAFSRQHLPQPSAPLAPLPPIHDATGAHPYYVKGHTRTQPIAQTRTTCPSVLECVAVCEPCHACIYVATFCHFTLPSIMRVGTSKAGAAFLFPLPFPIVGRHYLGL